MFATMRIPKSVSIGLSIAAVALLAQYYALRPQPVSKKAVVEFSKLIRQHPDFHQLSNLDARIAAREWDINMCALCTLHGLSNEARRRRHRAMRLGKKARMAEFKLEELEARDWEIRSYRHRIDAQHSLEAAKTRRKQLYEKMVQEIGCEASQVAERQNVTIIVADPLYQEGFLNLTQDFKL